MTPSPATEYGSSEGLMTSGDVRGDGRGDGRDVGNGIARVARRLQVYRTDAIEVTFDPNRCIHFAACVRTLPAVFDAKARP